jgi:hypothetical protein
MRYSVCHQELITWARRGAHENISAFDKTTPTKPRPELTGWPEQSERNGINKIINQ